MEDTPKLNRLILAILAVIVGIFMIVGAPFLIQTSMERVVAALIEISKEKPAYASGILLFSYLFPIFRGFIFVGGIALILLALPIYQGKKWTFPVSLLVAAFPSVGGMFLFMPYVSFIDGFPLPMIVSMVGLAFFWAYIFLRKEDKWVKWAQFLALSFIGMLATHAMITGTGNLRVLLTRPDKPMYAGLGEWILGWSMPVQWITFVMLILAIYYLASRKATGWWLALIAVVTLTLMDLSMQIIRITMTDSTSWDYSYGIPFIIGLLFTLFYPKFRKALVLEAPSAG